MQRTSLSSQTTLLKGIAALLLAAAFLGVGVYGASTFNPELFRATFDDVEIDVSESSEVPAEVGQAVVYSATGVPFYVVGPKSEIRSDQLLITNSEGFEGVDFGLGCLFMRPVHSSTEGIRVEFRVRPGQDGWIGFKAEVTDTTGLDLLRIDGDDGGISVGGSRVYDNPMSSLANVQIDIDIDFEAEGETTYTVTVTNLDSGAILGSWDDSVPPLFTSIAALKLTRIGSDTGGMIFDSICVIER